MRYIIILLFFVFSCEQEALPPCIEHPNFDCPTICNYTSQLIDTDMDSCDYEINLIYSKNTAVDSYNVVLGVDTFTPALQVDSTMELTETVRFLCGDSFNVHTITFFPQFSCFSDLVVSH